MKRLVSLRRVLEDAQEDGLDSDAIYVDPDDVCAVDDAGDESEEE